ncbi:rho GTPase-activating protein 100F [Anopheles aquasalis]|uniref:rho GTPase-activating protein 100F n=1 Tax=Anopheles aquasalis TaxID=42839 RepID=UPI00215B3288|nr:rho GTPase-activating protein 100F [Anopheles aquasalis]
MCDSATTGCFFSRSSKENGRSVPDLTASPGRAPPGPMPSHQAQALQQQQQQQNMQGHHQQQHQHSQQQQQHHQQQQRQGNKEPVLLQGDFRKVSGISSEIFRQIEAVENDHDPSTAAALEVVERRGEMIVRILEPRCMGSRQAIEAGQKFLNKSDARHTVQLVEIVKRPGQTLGLYIREGNGADRSDGVFISRIALESAVYNSGCLRVGDEILAVNLVDVTRMSLDDVVIIMSIPRRLVLAIRQRRGNRGTNSPGPAQMSRPEQKPPPVVVIKRDLRDEDLDDSDRAPRSSRSSRERRTGDGREMTESRSRLGLGLNNYSPQSEQLDLYYGGPGGGGGRGGPGGGGGPVETPSWGYKPPPPPSVITEQPKGMHGFQTSHSYYQNAGTLESLAEKVHAFYPSSTTTTNRRMSASGAGGGVAMSQSHQRFPRSGSDQHLPRVEYADYASLGRHGLLARSSLKSDLVGAAPIAGGTLGRYGRYDGGPGAGHQVTAASQRTSKYGPSPLGATASLQRRSRPALDYSSDTEATIGPRPSYYYYNHPAMAGNSNNTIHGAGPRGSTQALGGGPEFAKFNSLPRERPGAGASGRLGGLRGARGLVHNRLQDEADGNVSAPEYSLPIRRDIRDLRNRITASPSIFTSDEYRAWLRRAPSSSAICEQMRASRDLLNQQRAHRFSCSAENIHDVLKNTEHIYSSRTGLGGVGVGVGGTLDRHSMAAGGPRMSSLPVRSLSSQHIGGPSSIRSPSVRRMRQLLELTQGAHQGIGPGGGIGLAGVPGSMVSALTGHQSPAPTPSTTLPRPHRQIDINPAEYTKYKLDKPVVDAVGISGMLWIHLLAGRGLRAMSETSTQPLQQQPLIRDLYCVLECDRIHKARTVVRSGDLQFDWDESFELDLVCNKQLDVLVYSWDPQHRHKLCYRGALSLTTLLRQSPIHQLALKVEPRGTIYLRLRHTDPFQLFRRRGLPSLRGNVPALFGADLETVVTRESKGAPGCAPVPIILRRCVEEVERRGLDIIGLYRLCGSATKKRLLREAFERNSRAVELTPEHVPDINVITGVLKDYLRELPEPLFTKCLFQMTVDALGVCLPDDPEGNAKLMLSILDCLPRANRATLVFLLDHLSLVVSASERNKMSAQALATALGPPLMLHSASVGANEEIDHAQPIAVLKYLLQIWPQPHGGVSVGGVAGPTSGRRGEPVEPRGNKASALPAGKSQLQQPGALPLQSSVAPAAGSSISSSQRSSSSSNIHLSSRSNALASSTSHSNMASSILNTQQQQQQQPQHHPSSALLSIQPRTAASNPSATSSTLGQHLLSATPSTLQYQSVVAQLAQSHRALQQAGQQPHPSEVSAGLVERVQSPHHATPSPSSSSTSSASGSGSGTDTIKRGASPASVKFKESSSGYSLKSDTQSRILSGKQLYGNSTSSNTTSATNGHGVNGQSSRDGPGTGSTSTGPMASELLQQQTTTRASSLLFTAGTGTGDYRSSSSSIASSVASSIAAGPSNLSGPAPSSGALYGKAPTTTASSSAGPVPLTSTLNITTFSLDEKNNLVVSPSPSSASESSYRSSSPASSIQRDKSPISLGERQGHQHQPSSSPSALRRQEQFDRADSAPASGSSATPAATTTSTGSSSSSSFMSSLRSQTLGSYQFPSATLKLTSQLSSGGDAQQQQQQQQDDGSTSSLLRKLTSSLSRTIVSNTGTLPISLGREKLSELSSGLGVGSTAGGGGGGGGPSSTSSTGFSSSSGIGSISSSISSTSNSASGSTSGSLRTMSTSLGAYSGGGSAGGGGGGSVPDGSSMGHSGTAAVTSMNIYGTLPKNSSIYSSYGGSGGAGGSSSSTTGSSALSGLLSGTTSAYGISERLRALTTGSSLTGGGGGGGTGSSSDTGVSSHEQHRGSVSSSGDLDSSGYDYESSGFSSASYSTSTIDRGMASSGASLGSSSIGAGALSSSYFSTGSGSGSSPFATSATETAAATATAPYRVQYASTNPFLPSFNPTAPGSTDGGSNGSNGSSTHRNGGESRHSIDEPFDMK